MPTLYCRHIKTNGRRCLSPALRGKALCYFHHKANERHRSLNPPRPSPFVSQLEGETILHPMTVDPGQLQRAPVAAEYYGLAPISPAPVSPANASLSLPTLEDRESIQLALSVALQALAGNRIDAKRAYTLLFGLHVASRNAANLNLDSERVVLSTTENSEGVELAPDEDPIEIIQTEAILAEIQREDDEDDEDDEEQE